MGWWSKWFHKITTVDELVAKCKNPWELSCWLEFNIEYKRVFEYRQPPEKTLKLRSGNCVAFSNLAYACLDKLGFNPKIVEGMPKNASGPIGHTICAYYQDGRWSYLSNGVLVHTNQIGPLAGFVHYLHPDWEWKEVDTEGYIKEILQ